MRTFLLNGTSFIEGTVLTITAPELGTIDVKPFINFQQGIVIGLDLGWIQTGQPCKATGQAANARLSFYTNGQAYHSLQLAYHCGCPSNAHNRSLRWVSIVIKGQSIETDSLGIEFKEEHNHFIAPAFGHLRPQRAEPVIKPLHAVPLEQAAKVAPLPVTNPPLPDPAQKTNSYGQFQLF